MQYDVEVREVRTTRHRTEADSPEEARGNASQSTERERELVGLDELDPYSWIVTEVKCPGCAFGPIPGVVNGGGRCVSCNKYLSDHEVWTALARVVPELRDACLEVIERADAHTSNTQLLRRTRDRLEAALANTTLPGGGN